MITNLKIFENKKIEVDDYVILKSYVHELFNDYRADLFRGIGRITGFRTDGNLPDVSLMIGIIFDKKYFDVKEIDKNTIKNKSYYFPITFLEYYSKNKKNVERVERVKKYNL